MRAAFALLLTLLVPLAAAQAPEAPYGVHVGLAPDGGALALQWTTRAPASASAEVDGRAYAGTSEPLPQGAGFVHTVPLPGLAPGPHAWRLPGGAEGELVAPPGSGAARLAFLGDHGVKAASRATVELLAREAPDVVLHTGDIAYAEGDPREWDAWFALVEPVASRVPWLPALGNHETYFVAPTGALGDFVTEFRQVPNPEVEGYRARFALPGNELWWSADVGPVHVVALDTFYSVLAPGTPQALWLAEDLAAHADAPWTVVFLHEPPWSSNAHGSSARVQSVLAPIAEAAGVDLVVAGHDHGYERTWPLVGSGVVARAYVAGVGVPYLVTGGGGQSLYTRWEDPQPAWSAFRAAEYHVVVVDATEEALDVRAVLHDGTVLDAFRIERALPPGTLPGATEGVAVPGVGVGVLVVVAALALLRRRL